MVNRLRAMGTLILLSLLVTAIFGPARPATAAPALVEVLCNRVFLPMLWNGGGSGVAAAGVAQAVQITNDVCDGSPDFNGDGYADLVIGVPHKEVSNGIVVQANVGLVQVIYGSGHGLDAGAGQLAPDDQIWHKALLGGLNASPDDMYGEAVAAGDFNGDGFDDLAIGIPGANINEQDDAGSVHVIYGSAEGLALFSIEQWSRATDNVAETPDDGERFGSALATGDFDSDGYADLAIGVPYATVNGDLQAGAVHILYGQANGLIALGNELITQDVSGGVGTSAEVHDVYGWALAAGDFDGDGIDDLAVGAPFEDNGEGYDNAGSVQVYYGGTGHLASNSGLIRSSEVHNAQHWTADSPEVQGAMEPNEWFGYSLAAADFDGDGRDDLAVGIPHETHGSGGDALLYGGAINVFEGSADGLVSTPSKPAYLWHQESPDIVDDVAAMEQFGQSLAAADFDNDGYADLAIGVPGNQIFDIQLGSIHLMYGSSNGLNTVGNTFMYDTVNPQAGDWYGRSVTAGDFNGDGFVDLTVGASRDIPVGVAESDSGSVFVYYSDNTGPLVSQIQNWYPGHFGLKGAPDTNDYFGAALKGSPYRP